MQVVLTVMRTCHGTAPQGITNFRAFLALRFKTIS